MRANNLGFKLIQQTPSFVIKLFSQIYFFVILYTISQFK